jgi:hypothetical protein
MKKLAVFGLVLFCVSCLPAYCIFAGEIDHQDVWTSYFEKATTDNYYKYGIYAARLLAVKHPEIYLQADDLFIDLVNTKTMETRTWERSRMLDSHRFSIKKLELEKYENISNNNFYPPECKYFPFLDRRILSSASVLRTVKGGQIITQKKIKEIEEGILLYLQKKKENPNQILFLIYCDDESTYLIVNESLLSLKGNSVVEKVYGNPILIFNEEHVWYPLMERDDTDKNLNLSQIVTKYRTDKVFPELTNIEEELVQALRKNSLLTTQEQKDMAILSAAKCSSCYGFSRPQYRDKRLMNIWKRIFPEFSEEHIYSIIGIHPAGGLDNTIIKEIVKRGNFLSPLTSDFASLEISELREKYKKQLQWNCIWTLGLMEYSIDESYFSKGGTCDVHAVNYSSILDLAEIDNYLIHGYNPGEFTHEIVYVPKYDFVCSNNDIFRRNSIFSANFPNGLFLVSYKGKWATFTATDYYGNIPPQKTIEFLSFLQSQHNDNIEGLRAGGSSKISYDKLIENMKGDQYHNRSVIIELP